MKYNEELVKQVRKGKLAILNDGTKQELQELIKYIFPEDLSVKGDCLYYYHNKLECKGWFPTNLELNIPYKSVKDFVEEEFVLPDLYAVKCENEEERKEVWLHNFPSDKYYVKYSDYIIGGKDINKYGVIFLYWGSIKSAKIWFNKEDLPVFTFNEWKKLKETNMKEKEIIGYKLIKPEFRKAVNFMLDRIGNVLAQDGITKDYTTQHLLKDAGVLDIWFEPVYKEEKKLPKINGYDGKLDGDYIIYGSNCARFQKRFFEILEGFHKEHPQFNNNFSNQNRTIKSIKLNSGVEITMEQVKEIVEFLNTK